jgi:hypothetical protein
LEIVVAGDMLLLKDRMNDLGFDKIQILEKDGSGKFKYLKSGTTKHIKNGLLAQLLHIAK